ASGRRCSPLTHQDSGSYNFTFGPSGLLKGSQREATSILTRGVTAVEKTCKSILQQCSKSQFICGIFEFGRVIHKNSRILPQMI
ncbi:MAG: hypothetical protein ACYC9T_12235, partial [Trichloromonadaceae bacterium]